jgi:sorting nexin-8
MKSRSLNPKPLLDEELLTRAFEENSIPLKHAQTLWRHVTQNNTVDFKQVPYLSKKALRLLDDEFTLTTTKLVSRTDSSDGSTTKMLIETQDGHKIESVIMRYGDVALSSFPEEERAKRQKDGELTFKSAKRATLCVSSQVGCSMGCTFCGFLVN